jgi:hypothetical protein
MASILENNDIMNAPEKEKIQKKDERKTLKKDSLYLN